MKVHAGTACRIALLLLFASVALNLYSASIRSAADNYVQAPPAAADAIMMPPYGSAVGQDEDQDGVLDSAETVLAEHFAPIIIHDKDDLNLPANVDWLLSRTSLEYYSNNGLFRHDDHILQRQAPLIQVNLLGIKVQNGTAAILSDGVRSDTRRNTFVLRDVDNASDRTGSLDSTDWITYVHSFRNTYGGISIQYWRCYAYNTGDQTVTLPVQVDHHGGDWEAVEVVLGSDLLPVGYKFPGHTTIVPKTKNEVKQEGDHVVVYSEPGGHASHNRFDLGESITIGPVQYHVWKNDLRQAANTIRQETWTGGKVTWPSADWRNHIGGLHSPTGMLRNIGEKTLPLNGQVFIQYSGLWGSMGVLSSGYWGPAYNETQIGPNGFIRAWCSDMDVWKNDPNRYQAECYPKKTVP